MTKVAEIMTRDVQSVPTDASLATAGRLMDELDVGVLPVCEGGRVVGIVTDRDIAVRSVAGGRPPAETLVSDAMTIEVHLCDVDDDVAEVERIMRDAQIRRMPVIDAKGELVGIVSLGDLATAEAESVAATLRDISRPARPDR